MKRQSQFSEKRVVFQNIGAIQKGAEKLDDFTSYDAKATFKKSMEETIAELAEHADPVNPGIYAEKIKDSLRKYLKEGQDLDTLWEYLEKENCKYLAIIKGLLNFFRSKDDKIDITKLFTLYIPAESPEEAELAFKRKEVWAETAKQLIALRNEIAGSG